MGKLSEKEKMKITKAPQLACCERGCQLHGGSLAASGAKFVSNKTMK